LSGGGWWVQFFTERTQSGRLGLPIGLRSLTLQINLELSKISRPAGRDFHPEGRDDGSTHSGHY